MTRDSGAMQSRVPVIVRAIVIGLLVGMIPANVWLVFLVILKLPVPVAVIAELAFLAIYVWWARGGGPPQRLQKVRADYFRVRHLSVQQWGWGVVAAISAQVRLAAIVLDSRFTYLFGHSELVRQAIAATGMPLTDGQPANLHVDACGLNVPRTVPISFGRPATMPCDNARGAHSHICCDIGSVSGELMSAMGGNRTLALSARSGKPPLSPSRSSLLICRGEPGANALSG